MRRPEFIARQAGCPSGLLGRLLGRIMAVETASANDKALELLAIGPNDRVLEIGFGPGRTITRAAALASTGFVAGIDVSETMVRMATQRNRHLIQEGRVALHAADSRTIPYPNQSFDRVLTVHTLYFWSEPIAYLQEIYRVMNDGARLVLCFGPRDDVLMVKNFPETVYRFYSPEEVRSFLTGAGFVEIHLDCQAIASRDLVFALAQRPRIVEGHVRGSGAALP